MDLAEHVHPSQELIPPIHTLTGDVALDFKHPTVEANEGSTIACRDCFGKRKAALCAADHGARSGVSRGY